MQIRSIKSGVCCLAMLAATGIVHAGSLSNADQQFMTMAAKADMTEAHEGQMAEHQARRTDVKDFAKTLVRDHTESYERLTELAAQTGVSIPKGIDSGRDRTIQQLVHLKGARFDRVFSKDEIVAHRQAIAAFKREAAHGQDANVKAYASKMIPVLETQLHLAEECLKPTRHT
jgi:putative membrane protein